MLTLIKKFRYSIFLLAVIFCTSCRISLLPSYNQELALQIDHVSKEVDKFYLNMVEKTKEANDRTYNKFINGYIDIEVELNSLYTKNRIRPLNENSTRICEIALQKWIDYKEDHKKKNSISDGVILLNKKYMNDLFYTMQVAEQAKKE